MRRFPVFVFLSLLVLAGCDRRKPEPATGQQPDVLSASKAPAVRFHAAGSDASRPPQEAAAQDTPAARQYMAVRHDLRIQTEADGVEPAWRAANEACEAAGCEVLSASLIRNERGLPATAQLEARVPPDKLDVFLKKVSALGSVGEHSRSAEDKTDEVIDTEAGLKNMTEFRDNLRRLLAKPGAKLADLIEVQRELTRVQTELDSLASRRKVLASLTDKVHVSMAFTARPELLTSGAWEPVREAFTGAGRVLAGSLAGLITFAVAVLPWASVMLVGAWIARVLWRRRVRRPEKA